MLEWLQMMKLAAGQSDHQCCFFFFFKALLITGSGKLFVTFVKVSAGNTEASRSRCVSPRRVWICKASLFFFFLCCKVSTRKREIVWKPFASQGRHGEKPHRAELCKNVWCRFLSWAYATFCFREAVFVRWPFFTELQLWPWGGRAGQGQHLSGPLWALWHAWPGQKHKVSRNRPIMLLFSDVPSCYCTWIHKSPTNRQGNMLAFYVSAN